MGRSRETTLGKTQVRHDASHAHTHWKSAQAQCSTQTEGAPCQERLQCLRDPGELCGWNSEGHERREMSVEK